MSRGEAGFEPATSQFMGALPLSYFASFGSDNRNSSTRDVQDIFHSGTVIKRTDVKPDDWKWHPPSLER